MPFWFAGGLAGGLVGSAARAAGSVFGGSAAFNAESAFNLLQRLRDGVLSQFEAGITVRVVGGPDADIRRVWYLALSAAFGRYRNRVKDYVASCSIQGTWEVTAKACTVEIAYRTSSLNQWIDRTITRATENAPAVRDLLNPVNLPDLDTVRLMVAGGGVAVGIPPPRVDPRSSPYAFLHRGPEQLTVGGGWPSWLLFGGPGSADSVSWRSPVPCRTTLPALAVRTRVIRYPDVFREFPVLKRAFYPAAVVAGFIGTGVVTPANVPGVTATGRGMVALPDDGRVITTAEKNDPRVQAPRPSVDGATRGGMLGMVMQALQSPCYLPDIPDCTRTDAAESGVRLAGYPVGAAEEFNALANRIEAARNTNTTSGPPVADVPLGLLPNFTP